MLWGALEREGVAPPAAALSLLERAIAASPGKAALHVKLANLHVDRFDFGAATTAFEAALRLDPDIPDLRIRLAACYNVLKQHGAVLDLLAADRLPRHDRGIALAALGRTAEAEAQFRAVLAEDPHNRQACRMLCRLLRRDARWRELLETCESLAACGVAHSQLLYDWGVALALAGDEQRARAILLDPARVVRIPLPSPDGRENAAAFNAALADDILANPHRVSDFATDEAANRGSSRVHALLEGRRPELMRSLVASLQAVVGGLTLAPAGPFDPWVRARPPAARLQAWGLIQRGGEHEEWHLHRDGWLSGVYYLRVPEAVSAKGSGRGCIEFGPPGTLARLRPDFIPILRIEPVEGMLVLAPSHYPHRTIPTGTDDHRISLAFDVAPARAV
jgi:hypothetical protein